jgi:hypothetical protein
MAIRLLSGSGQLNRPTRTFEPDHGGRDAHKENRNVWIRDRWNHRYHLHHRFHREENLTDWQSCQRAESAWHWAEASCLSTRRLIMTDRIDFEILCPNDHDQTVTFSQDDFEAELKSGELVFHCNTCDTDWPPSHRDIAEFRKQFSKGAN